MAKLFCFTLNVLGAGLLGVLAGNGDLKGVGISRSAPRTTVLAGVSGTKISLSSASEVAPLTSVKSLDKYICRALIR